MLFTKRVCNCMGADHGKHIDFRNLHGKGSLELTFVRDHVCKAVSEAATTCTKEVEISTAAFAIPSQHHARKHWFSMLGVVQVGHCLHESSKRTKPFTMPHANECPLFGVVQSRNLICRDMLHCCEKTSILCRLGPFLPEINLLESPDVFEVAPNLSDYN